MTGVAASRCSSSASFTSDTTKSLSHCAISNGPRELGLVDGATVDDARLAVHRVDAEARPREIGEREPGEHAQRHLASRRGLVQQRDRALGDRRVAGHAVHDVAVLGGEGDQLGDDAAVVGVEIRGGVVVRVERLEGDALGRELVARGMTRGAHEARRTAVRTRPVPREAGGRCRPARAPRS